MSQTNGSEQQVKVRVLSWKELVLKRLGKDANKPDPGYEFTGRKFDTPQNGGPYRAD
jgi:hypothetical protein